MLFTCSLLVGILCHSQITELPLTVPIAGPAALGPLHEPEILLPDCAKTHVGAVVSTTGLPSVALIAHSPANIAAAAVPRIVKLSANALTSANAAIVAAEGLAVFFCSIVFTF
jgi:hypothetical protein